MGPRSRVFRIGTRASALALAQARAVAQALRRRHPALRLRIVKVRTAGDEFKSVELFRKNRIGVFTNAIERKLLDGSVDVAVHSLKDLPTRLAAGLMLAAVPKRASVSDVLISRDRHTLKTLPAGARVGTGSPRRKSQLHRLRPDLDVVDVRGNLDTRVSKVLKKKTLDGIVVARAGLERLKRFRRNWTEIGTDTFLPAVGQGALGLEVRKSDRQTRRLVGALNHADSERLADAERTFLARLRGGCRVPVGILSKRAGARIRLRAAVFSTRTDDFVEARIDRPWAASKEAARALADTLLRRGARRFLKEARA